MTYRFYLPSGDLKLASFRPEARVRDVAEALHRKAEDVEDVFLKYDFFLLRGNTNILSEVEDAEKEFRKEIQPTLADSEDLVDGALPVQVVRKKRIFWSEVSLGENFNCTVLLNAGPMLRNLFRFERNLQCQHSPQEGERCERRALFGDTKPQFCLRHWLLKEGTHSCLKCGFIWDSLQGSYCPFCSSKDNDGWMELMACLERQSAWTSPSQIHILRDFDEESEMGEMSEGEESESEREEEEGGDSAAESERGESEQGSEAERDEGGGGDHPEEFGPIGEKRARRDSLLLAFLRALSALAHSHVTTQEDEILTVYNHKHDHIVTSHLKIPLEADLQGDHVTLQEIVVEADEKPRIHYQTNVDRKCLLDKRAYQLFHQSRWQDEMAVHQVVDSLFPSFKSDWKYDSFLVYKWNLKDMSRSLIMNLHARVFWNLAMDPKSLLLKCRKGKPKVRFTEKASVGEDGRPVKRPRRHQPTVRFTRKASVGEDGRPVKKPRLET